MYIVKLLVGKIYVYDFICPIKTFNSCYNLRLASALLAAGVCTLWATSAPHIDPVHELIVVYGLMCLCP